eukprot:7213839-Karenia_brevis.AAC.1
MHHHRHHHRRHHHHHHHHHQVKSSQVALSVPSSGSGSTRPYEPAKQAPYVGHRYVQLTSSRAAA